MHITIVTTVDDKLLAAMNRLLPQLTPNVRPLTREQLETIVESEPATLLIASDGDRILGSLTLISFTIPSKKRAWIEDVVVDASARGRGIGRALTERAIELALSRGAETIDLTSSPERIAANKLYQSLGFRQRKTNLYRYEGVENN